MKRQVRSIGYAFTAAALFGANAPLAKLLLRDVSPIMLAAFLYLGSGVGILAVKIISGITGKEKGKEARLTGADLRWLLGATIAGGIVAPIALMFALQHTPAASAALLLNFEGLATTLIAFLFFRESVSRRIWVAVIIITAAVILLSLDLSGQWGLSIGALAVLAACVLWGLDNNLTRNVSAKDPLDIVIIKGIVAGSCNLVLAFSAGNSLPGIFQVFLSCLLGLFSYGLSIAFFILALRELGAARTSAYFATAPFIGTALSLLIFREMPNTLFMISVPLMVIGVIILFGEKHAHVHAHSGFEHEHVHEHADPHHTHPHPEGTAGAKHAHLHIHQPLTHEHLHSPDIHHRHGH
jgi:drug/metabolite transporter (DMT)-like permease